MLVGELFPDTKEAYGLHPVSIFILMECSFWTNIVVINLFLLSIQNSKNYTKGSGGTPSGKDG